MARRRYKLFNFIDPFVSGLALPCQRRTLLPRHRLATATADLYGV